jgi:predicted nucleic acid-binding Zn ribbon protein
MDPKRGGLQDGRRDVGEALLVGMEMPRLGQPVAREAGSLAASTTAPCVEQQPFRPDDKLKQRCHHCGKPFCPRHGSGGSPQRFCSTECRNIFNKERQRTRRRAAYVAPPERNAPARAR